jgi:hypothetical protein
MRHLLASLFICLLAACNNSSPVPEKTIEQEPIDNTRKETTPVTDTLIANEQRDSTIIFRFERDSSSLTAKGTLHSADDHITGYLDVDRKATLSGQLIPQKNDMNIRFTQLIMPDSSMDGPFGKQLQYKLTQKGKYKIIISANNMAGGQTKGDFLVRLTVK